MSIRFHKVDPKALRTIPGEKGDCCVRAMATVCNVPYAEAHAVLATWGRRPGRGMSLSQFRGHGEILGWKLTQIPVTLALYPTHRDRPTLAQALRRMQSGRYFVTITRHALAVIDGVVHDGHLSGARCRVDGIWKLERKAPVAPIPASIPAQVPVQVPVIQPLSSLPWAVQRYFALRSAGDIIAAGLFYIQLTPKVQAMIDQHMTGGVK